MTRFVRNLTFLLIAAVMSSAVAGQSLVFRSGGTQGATDTLTRSCVVRETSSPGNATVVEATTLDLGSTPSQPGGHGLIDFPQIIGTGPSQVPAGATIQSATLELYCIAAGGGSSSARTVHCKVLSDYPHRLGPWIEPVTTSAVAQLAVGASWLARDTRITGQRPWSPLTTSGGPSVVTDPAILAALPGLNAQLTFTPNGSPGVGQYHAFNVTQAVQVWARGFSNQGFLISVNSNGLPVTYAADDHPTAAWRPRLTVTWGGPPNPFSILLNRVPEGLGTAPANPTTATGVPFSILLLANDPDGTNPEFVVIDQPKHGRLEGVVPYLSYYPDAGFVGQDDFSFIARDAIATSFLKTVAIQVTGGGGSQSATWQEGIAPAGDVTRACTAKWSRSLGAQVTYEDTTFRAQKEFRQGFLDFPQLFGTQGQRIPLGSTIVSARLELTMASVANNGVPRTLSLHRIIDPLDRAMTWHEPAITLSESQPAVPNQGVSHLFLDARATPPDAWSKAGGDISPFDVAGARVQAPDIGGAVKQFDVTAALQAWSSGAPNFGWVVRSSAPNDVTLIHSDDAALATDRPKLVVTWRPPVAGPPSGTVAPTAHAGPDQDVFSNTRVQLDANGSYHLQGLNFDVAWAQISGPHAPLIPAPNTPAGTFVGITLRPQFIAPIVTAPTDLEFLLVAIRGGDFTIDTVTVRVSPQPGGGSTSSPLIDAGPDQTVVELSTTTLAAQISGGIGPFESVWTKISGPAITLASPDALSTTFVSPPVSSAGADLLFEIELIDLGAPFSSVVRDTVAVHINNIQNQAPIARAGVDLDVDVGDWVVLDASASSDADGHPLVFTWSQSSGPGVPLTQYRSAGTAEAARTPFKAPIVTVTTTLTFSVLVSDNELSHTDQITVTVRPNINEFSGNPSSLAPYGPTLTKREVRHLLRRVGAGWHPEDVGIVQSASRDPQIGLDGIVTAMMVPMLQDSPEAMAIFDEAMNYAAALASPSAGTPTKNQPFDPYVSPTTTQMMATWTVYTLRSPAPLHERLTRFWHGRLAASVRNLADGRRHWSLLHSDMLRFGVRVDCYTNAPNIPVTQCPLIAGTGPYGNYREILIAWLNDPLTLAFIDGFDNLRFAPNENLGREFMELHSLGILDENGVPIYGENDVKEVARAFTGWRPSCFVVDQSRPASCFPSFVTFFHDYGQKSILGSAPFDFDDVGVVDRVLSYDGGDNAARWLARGLLKYFVTHEPSPALVQALAAEILQNNWELSPTLHTLLSSQAMFAAVHRKALVQSPVDLCNGMIRTLRVSLQSRDIVQADIRANLDILGHRLGDPTDVNGFPEDVEWLDEFAVIRRSELIRKILLRARQPSLPEPQPGSPPGTLPDAPNHLSVAVAIDAFLPPVGARNTENTTRLLMELLDVDLHQTAAVGAAVSEFVLARDYLDLPTSGAFPGPFDGDNPGHDDRLWSLIHLLFEHPEFQRM